MAWTDHLHERQAYWGAPDLDDGDSRVGEAMGGLADDDCGGATLGGRLVLDDQNRVHEAMGGMCRADDA
jgi:hypothetical protein